MYLYFPDTPRTFVGLPEDGISAPTHVAVDMMYYMVQMLDDILTARNVSAYTAGSWNVKLAHRRWLSLFSVWEKDNVANI